MPDEGRLTLRAWSVVQAGAITGFIAAFTESPIDFYKSQIQYQIIRSKSNPDYKRAPNGLSLSHALIYCVVGSAAWRAHPATLSHVYSAMLHGGRTLLEICSRTLTARASCQPPTTLPTCAAAFTTVSGCVAATIRQNGFRGPFQGLGATLVRNTPANAIYLGSFEVFKTRAAQAYNCKCGHAPSFWL